MNRHARVQSRRREAQGIVERVEVSAAPIMQPAEIGNIHRLARLGRREQVDVRIVHDRGQAFSLVLHSAQVSGLGGPCQMARRLQIAGDAVFADETRHQVPGLEGQIQQALGALGPESPHKLRRALPQARNDLAAVSPGGAPADLAALQDHDPEPPAGRVQRGGEARAATADNDQIRGDIAGEGRLIHPGIGRGGVVGLRHRQGAVKQHMPSDLEQKVVSLP